MYGAARISAGSGLTQPNPPSSYFHSSTKLSTLVCARSQAARGNEGWEGKSCSDEEAIRRREADGFRIGRRIFVKPQSWKNTDTDKPTRSSKRSATIDRKIMGVPGKRRYYVIDGDKLAAVIAAAVDQGSFLVPTLRADRAASGFRDHAGLVELWNDEMVATWDMGMHSKPRAFAE